MRRHAHVPYDQAVPGGGRIRCIYITPLRALNRDVFGRITRYAEEMGLTIQIRHGDTPQSARRRIARSPPDVLVTTPETAVVLLSQPEMLKALSGLQWAVIDEVHELLPGKRGAQLAVTLERLQMNSAYPLTRVGLSATVGSPLEAAKRWRGARRKCLILRDAAVRRYDVKVLLEKGGMPAAADAVLPTYPSPAYRRRCCSSPTPAARPRRWPPY